MPLADPFHDLKRRDYLIRHALLEGQELPAARVKAELNAFQWQRRSADASAWRPAPAFPEEWPQPLQEAGATVLPKAPPVAAAEDAVARKFRKLADQWLDETQLISSLTEMVLHPAYQQVIGMGEAVVPLILQELQERPAHWFWALRAITGENPVPKEDAGRTPRMAEHWVEWGRRRGILR